MRRDARAAKPKGKAAFGQPLAGHPVHRPTMTQGETSMRIPNSPLFKRYEVYVVLAFALIFVVVASLNVVM